MAGLPLTIWVTHFFYFRHFGFYENDYALVSPAFGWSLTAARSYSHGISDLHARTTLEFLLAAVLFLHRYAIRGVHVAYLIAFSVDTVNAFLVYILLKKLTAEIIAVTATLTFCLFPAGTTHTFLTNAFHLQTSLIFLLLASLCYLSGRRIPAYLIIPGSLLTL